MDPNVFSLLSGLGFLLCMLGIALVFSAVIVTGLIVVLRARTQLKPYSPPVSNEDHLASARLTAWTAEAFSDLSSRLEGHWRGYRALGRQESYGQGVVKSLRSPNGPGWLAFTLQRSQVRNAAIVIKTSGQQVEVKVASTGPADPNVRGDAAIDGRPRGTITLTYPNVAFVGTDGVEAHWVADPRRYDASQNLGPLTVNGRPIAALSGTWVRYPSPQRTAPYHAAVQEVAGSLRQAEQDVLLIALALSLYYDDQRRRRSRYDG